jgi:hypothetical protein
MIERLSEYSTGLDFLAAVTTYPRSLGRGQFRVQPQIIESECETNSNFKP